MLTWYQSPKCANGAGLAQWLCRQPHAARPNRMARGLFWPMAICCVFLSVFLISSSTKFAGEKKTQKNNLKKISPISMQGRMAPGFHVLCHILTLPSEYCNAHHPSFQATFSQPSIVQFGELVWIVVLVFCSYKKGLATCVVLSYMLSFSGHSIWTHSSSCQDLVWTSAGHLEHVCMPECTELIPCDWVIR